MKKIYHVLVLTLALNFLALAGGIGWLVQNKKIDKPKLMAIREIVFPTTKPTTQPTDVVAGDPTTQPMLRLEEALAKSAGRSASEQVDFIQHAFDAQMSQLDRRERELSDLSRQVELAKQQATRDRAALEKQQKDLVDRQQLQKRNETDKGFQDALALYNKMPSKQVKEVFKTMPDEQVVQFLQSMQPRNATRILKEFKTPEEQDRVAKIMEKLRQPQASTKDQ
jgi:flagellar motility protein MotE (MotC chaperone)